ncbi:hypothetical protein CEXT_278451 [Caerostris extrusa]|uniref:LAGLIDADG homing endonuclease n=1 Tax=Caerostris extrusa TaxID=172846 RepID=A0AAV4WEP9_CAEEX|nr:hypothetical protein CEXT_278451 [Caerostris extrusa]
MNCPAFRKTPTKVTNSKTSLIQTLSETRKEAVLFALCAKVMEKEHFSFYSSTNEAISFSGHEIWLWLRKFSLSSNPNTSDCNEGHLKVINLGPQFQQRQLLEFLSLPLQLQNYISPRISSTYKSGLSSLKY